MVARLLFFLFTIIIYIVADILRFLLVLDWLLELFPSSNTLVVFPRYENHYGVLPGIGTKYDWMLVSSPGHDNNLDVPLLGSH